MHTAIMSSTYIVMRPRITDRTSLRSVRVMMSKANGMPVHPNCPVW